MKKGIVVSFIVFLFFAAAAIGRLLNSQFIFDTIRSDALFKARLSIEDFKKRRDPNYKTLVVFGTSSSLFSYPDNEKSYYPQNLSYVDLMPKNVNVLNLSNHHFFSFEQFEAVLALMAHELPKIDYVILENLRFMAPTPRLVEEWDYIVVASRSCLRSQNNPRMHTICSDIFSQFFETFKLSSFSASACVRKFDKLLTFSYFQSAENRQKIIVNALKCDWHFQQHTETKQFIIEKFRFGQLMDLDWALKNLGENLSTIDPKVYRESYFSLDQVILNFYLNKLAEKNRQLNFLVIPSSAKMLNSLDGIEALQSRENLHFFEINSYLENVLRVNHQSFIDLFPDGSHAKLWIHQYLAQQISLKYLQ